MVLAANAVMDRRSNPVRSADPLIPHVRLSGVRRATHGNDERRVVGRRRCPRGHDTASLRGARRRPARVARRAVYARLREPARPLLAELLAADVDLDWRGRYARWWRSARDASRHMVRLPRGGVERRVAARDGVAACGACAGRHVGLRTQDVGGPLRGDCRQGGVARADRQPLQLRGAPPVEPAMAAARHGPHRLRQPLTRQHRHR
eukprot:scaffold5217_cov75-Phaeocystis_antarctica.AAC.3